MYSCSRSSCRIWELFVPGTMIWYSPECARPPNQCGRLATHSVLCRYTGKATYQISFQSLCHIITYPCKYQVEADPKSFNRPKRSTGNLSSQRMVAFCHKNWPEPSEFSLLQEVLEPVISTKAWFFGHKAGVNSLINQVEKRVPPLAGGQVGQGLNSRLGWWWCWHCGWCWWAC